MISVINNNNNKSEFGDDHMMLISQMCPVGVLYEQMETSASQQPSPEDKKSRTRRRSKKGKACSGADVKKRKLSDEQVRLLELSFGNEHKLECERKDRLARKLGLDPRQVAVWFQNRRARWKIKKLEEEYSRLKAAHDSLLLRNCQLESQVIKLEERLAGEERTQVRIRKLSSEGTSSNTSPTISCFSMEQPAMDHVAPLFLEGLEDEGFLTNVVCNISNYVNSWPYGMV